MERRSKKLFLCHILAFLALVSIAKAQCPNGFTNVEDTYCVQLSPRRTPAKARQYCNSISASIFDIENEDHRDVLGDWLSDQEIYYIWTTARPDNNRVYRWHSGDPSQNEVRQPDDSLVVSGRQNTRKCLLYNTFVERYQRDRCQKKHQALCLYSTVATTTSAPTTAPGTTTAAPSGCPSNFAQSISGVNKCYRAFNTLVNHDDAISACTALGSGIHLMEPKSAAENSYNFFNNNEGTWLGIRDTGSEGTFRYESTSTVITYDNWGIGEPNNLGNEGCVMRWATGYWNDQACSHTLYYVCEYDL